MAWGVNYLQAAHYQENNRFMVVDSSSTHEDILVFQADVNNDLYQSARHAIFEDDSRRLNRYLDLAGETIITQVNDAGQTLLHESVMYCSCSLIAGLLNHGASVYARDGGGNTPLHAVVASDNREKVRVISALLPIDACCETVYALLFAQNNKGQTPLHIAVEKGDVKAVDRLLAICVRHNLSAETYTLIPDNTGNASSTLAINKQVERNSAKYRKILFCMKGYLDQERS